MQTPYFIKNDDELKRLHLQGKATGNGFIYNDYSGANSTLIRNSVD